MSSPTNANQATIEHFLPLLSFFERLENSDEDSDKQSFIKKNSETKKRKELRR